MGPISHLTSSGVYVVLRMGSAGTALLTPWSVASV